MKYFPNIEVILARLYNLLHEDVPFHWNEEHETVFNNVIQTSTKTCELTLPNAKEIFLMVDTSACGVGTVLDQAADQDQMQILSCISRIFTENEHKIATKCRELNAIVHALKIYELLSISSKDPRTVLTDHKPILSFLARKSNINFCLFRYQIVFRRFSKLVFFWTQG